MLSFACHACGEPLRLPEVHAWRAGIPLCSPGCVDKPLDAPAWTPTPVRVDALLTDLGAFLQHSIQQADQAVSAGRTADTASSIKPLVGRTFGILGAIVTSEIERVASQQDEFLTDLLWELDQRMHPIVGEMMALHELGLALPRPLHEALQTLEQLDRHGDLGLKAALLRQLFQQLSDTLYHVRQWRKPKTYRS